MIEELNRIIHYLRRLGRITPDLLQPGLTPEQIAALAAQLPFALPEDAEAIYGWHNGTRVVEGDQLDTVYFFPGHYFLSLDEAVETYFEREDSAQWRKEWFPLFADGGGDFYLACCGREKRPTSEIIGFLHGEPEQIVEYESLEAMVKTLEACFAEGAFFLDGDDTLEMDDELHRQIARRFNPEIEEWQD